ncbi:MAG TPA: serine/threonine-protein kinase PknK, partial [Stenomitos sp.]
MHRRRDEQGFYTDHLSWLYKLFDYLTLSLVMLLNLPHYQEINKLYAGTRTLVYRAIRVTDGQTVVIKALQNLYPNFNELVQFLNQYVITRHLKHPGIVTPLALERYGNGYALVMPDDGAIALSDYWQQSSRSLSEFLTIAIQLAEALHYLIQQRIIHKDIKPGNILIHPETRQVKLIDFSISSLLPKEQQQLTNPNGLEGTLAYISPEQTGRMNRGIDYRTDFYSLGVTFFELLTGKLPFESSDPMELVHCHIAQALPTPHTPHPTPIIDIVLKLMAKNAEERYQSALGLKHDLERCQQELEVTGKITPFELGERDICDRFLISEKLYGREAQVQTLLDAFERVSEGSSEIMLVAGFSGIGKTAVINEVYKPILKQRGYFIKGKFDQFNRNIPFSAFVQAFRDLMRQLMSDSDEKLAHWQEKILAAVGENGQVIIDVIPELEEIIGKQSPVPELSGSAAQNRFHLIFGKFVRVFTTKEHPLVIFLDDLQWADSASLNLLKLLMDESEAGYLLVLGAYRDNEVFGAHPLMLTLEELKKAEKPLHTITLTPLTFPDTNQLVADTLHCSTERSHPLTSLLFRKTQGNPFFTNQFLKALHEDEHIKFNSQEGYWQCDIAQVNRLSLTDDVVEFMAQQLRKLPRETQEVLKLAACIGNEFDLETLAIVSQQSPTITAKALWSALQEGLILTTGQSYKFFQAEETDPSNSEGSANLLYRFLHDRVQQAAYCLIPDHQKQQTHLKIGRLLHAQADQGKHLFEILNHMNESAALIVEEEERRLLRKLNLVGCQRAKLATAYGAAVEYANAAMGLLPADAWASEYDYVLALYEAAAEAAYLNTDFATAEERIETILNNTQEFIEGIKAYELLVQIYIAKDQQVQAIETGLEALKKLGVCLVDRSDWQEQLPSLPSEQTLATGPEMTNPAYLAALRILITITPPTHHVKPELFPAVVLTMVDLCDRGGFSSLAAYTYGIYGLLLCALVEDPDTAHRSGKLSLQLLEQFHANDLRTKVNMLFAVFICAGKEAGQETLPLLKQGIEVGFEVGDIEYVSYCIMAYFSHLFLLGKPLEEIEESRQIYLSALEQFKQKHCIEYSNLWLQVAEEFTGTARSESAESSILEHFETTHNHQCLFAFHLSKLISSYTFAEHERALDHAIKALASQEAAFGVLLTAAHSFYHALALLATFNSELTSVQQQALLKQIATNQGKLEQLSVHAPSNYQHKLDLVTAEKYRVLGQKTVAIEYYDRAIAGAKENKYIQEEALANELAAKFYLDWGKEKIAAVYMQEAYYCYARWGAKAKTDHLSQNYPQLLTPILQQPPS